MKNARNLLILFFCLSLCAGCGSGRKSVAEIMDTNIKKVRALYSFYMTNHRYRGPKDEDAFKKWLASTEGRFAIKRMEMDATKLEDYFISERDGEPFEIRYGLKGIRDHAIVFEKTGDEDGKRLVALGKPIACDEELYNDYLTGAIQGESGANIGNGEDEAAENDSAEL